MDIHDLREIVSRAVSYREESKRVRYPIGAVEMICNAAMGKLSFSSSREEWLETLSDVMESFERPFYSNPAWDGSIG